MRRIIVAFALFVITPMYTFDDLIDGNSPSKERFAQAAILVTKKDEPDTLKFPVFELMVKHPVQCIKIGLGGIGIGVILPGRTIAQILLGIAVGGAITLKALDKNFSDIVNEYFFKKFEEKKECIKERFKELAKVSFAARFKKKE
jgi:hypothetical protein